MLKDCLLCLFLLATAILLFAGIFAVSAIVIALHSSQEEKLLHVEGSY